MVNSSCRDAVVSIVLNRQKKRLSSEFGTFFRWKYSLRKLRIKGKSQLFHTCSDCVEFLSEHRHSNTERPTLFCGEGNPPAAIACPCCVVEIIVCTTSAIISHLHHHRRCTNAHTRKCHHRPFPRKSFVMHSLQPFSLSPLTFTPPRTLFFPRHPTRRL